MKGNEKQFEFHLASLDLSDNKVVFQGEKTQIYWSPDSQRIAFQRSGENASFAWASIDGTIQPLSQPWARDITWIDPESLLFFRDGEYWLVTTDNKEYLLATSEFYLPMQYFREFDISFNQ